MPMTMADDTPRPMEDPVCTDSLYRGHKLITQFDLDKRWLAAQKVMVAELGAGQYQVCSDKTCVIVTPQHDGPETWLCKHVMAAVSKWVEKKTGKRVVRFLVPGVSGGVEAIRLNERFRIQVE